MDHFEVGDRVEPFFKGAVTYPGTRLGKFDSVLDAGYIIALLPNKSSSPFFAGVVMLIDPDVNYPFGRISSYRHDQIRHELTPGDITGYRGSYHSDAALQITARRCQRTGWRKILNWIPSIEKDLILYTALTLAADAVRIAASKPEVKTQATLHGYAIKEGNVLLVQSHGGSHKAKFVCEAGGWYIVQYGHGGIDYKREEGVYPFIPLPPKKKLTF